MSVLEGTEKMGARFFLEVRCDGMSSKGHKPELTGNSDSVLGEIVFTITVDCTRLHREAMTLHP